MKLLCLSFLLFAFGIHSIFSQSITGVFGAEEKATGGIAVTSSSIWNVLNNPGGQSNYNTICTGIFTENNYLVEHNRLSALVVQLPFNKSSIGMGLIYSGYEAFNQKRWSLSIQKELSKHLSVGIQVNLVSTAIQNYGNRLDWVSAFGLQTSLSSRLKLGLHVFNPNLASNELNAAFQLPVIGKIGLAYQISTAVEYLAECTQSLNLPMNWRTGLKYRFHPVFTASAGWCMNPFIYSFGCQILWKNLSFDFACSVHEVLGLTPSFSCSMPLSGKGNVK
jgi:hypothetical protein